MIRVCALSRRTGGRPGRVTTPAHRAHRSQIGGGPNARLFGALLRLPPQVFGVLIPYEWFVEPATPSEALRHNIFGNRGRGTAS